jgi:hypothetical protein
MTNSNNLSFAFIAQNQSQKEVTANEALAVIDAVLNRGAVSQGDATPPVSPSEGDLYILGTSATGDWATHDKEVAYYFNSIWSFITPNEGMMLWVSDDDKPYVYDGSNWIVAASRYLDDLNDVAITSAVATHILQHNGTEFVNQNYMDNLARVGINTTSDATNKFAVSSDAILFTTATGDAQVKVNKATSTDTASFLFQDNNSGRAELGLIGSDDFELKVSDDGSSFYQSFTVARATGKINIKQDTDFSDKILSRAELKDCSETVVVNATSGATATLDLESGNVHDVTLTANCTFTFSNSPATGKSGSFTLVLKQDATGSRVVTWPAAVKWAGGSAPTFSVAANSVDILTFFTTDSGTIWYGFSAGIAMA